MFIVLEGADGTGKSTHAKMLAEYLRNKGLDVVLTQEPTKGEIGKEIRAVLGGKKEATPLELTKLFTEDRKEHVEKVIQPALDRGKIVISDRFYYSTVAYQSAQGVDKNKISEMNSFVPEPDLVVLVEVTLDEADSRMRHREKEVFEVTEFQKKVQQNLLDLADGGCAELSKPGKVWTIINNSGDLKEVQNALREIVDRHLE